MKDSVTKSAANREFAAMLADEYILSLISLSTYIQPTEFYQLLLLSSSSVFQSAAAPGWTLLNTSTAASPARCTQLPTFQTMRLFLVLYSLTFLLSRCDTKQRGDKNSSDNQQKPTSYEELTAKEERTKINSDTILLGFILTSQKTSVMRHVDSLILAGKLEKKVKDFTIWGEPGDYHKFEFEGYPYKIHMNAVDSFRTYISFDFFNDKLYRVSLNVRELPPHDVLREFLTSIYGEPNYIDDAGMHHWIKGQRDIELTRGFIPITFTSIQLDSENRKLRTKVDSISSIEQKSKIDNSRSDFK